MSQTLATLFVCLLHLLADTFGSPASAMEPRHNSSQYYGNFTEILPLETLESPFPYNFPDHSNLDNLFPMPDCHGLVLEEATVDFLQNAMSEGQLTSTKIALCYLRRIYQMDDYTK